MIAGQLLASGVRLCFRISPGMKANNADGKASPLAEPQKQNNPEISTEGTSAGSTDLLPSLFPTVEPGWE